MDPKELIAFKFEGGLANQGTMNFYSASRFQYGAARFLLKIAHYQQTGRVLQKVSVKIDCDYRIIVTEEGSWLERVWDFGKDLSTKKYITVPVKTLFNVVLGRLSPKRDPHSITLELAKIDLDKSNVMLDRDRIMEGLAYRALDAKDDLINYLKEENNKLKDKNSGPVFDIVQNNLQALESQENLRKDILNYSDEISSMEISGDTAKLIQYNESAIRDMFVPVANQNVDRMLIGTGDFENFSGMVDIESVNNLEGVETSVETLTTEGAIKSYDFETGWGKFRNFQFPGTIPFVVDSTVRKYIESDVVAAAQARKGGFVFRYVRSKNSGKVVRLVLDKVIDYGN